MAQQISANCVVCHTMSLWAKGAFAVFPEREKRLWDNSLRCKKDTYLISSFIIEFFEEILQPTRCFMKLCLIKQTEVYKLCVIQMLHKILGSLLVSLQHCGEVWPGSQVVACVTLRGNQFKNSHIYIVGNSSKISFFLKKKNNNNTDAQAVSPYGFTRIFLKHKWRISVCYLCCWVLVQSMENCCFDSKIWHSSLLRVRLCFVAKCIWTHTNKGF